MGTLVNKHVVKGSHFCKGSFSYLANCVYMCLNLDTCGKRFYLKYNLELQIIYAFNNFILHSSEIWIKQGFIIYESIELNNFFEIYISITIWELHFLTIGYTIHDFLYIFWEIKMKCKPSIISYMLLFQAFWMILI